MHEIDRLTIGIALPLHLVVHAQVDTSWQMMDAILKGCSCCETSDMKCMTCWWWATECERR